MVINVQNQEISSEVIVVKSGDSIGISFLLKSPQTSVTFWLSRDKDVMDRRQFASILRNAADKLEQLKMDK